MPDFYIIALTDHKFLTKHFEKIFEEYKLANPQFKFTDDFIELNEECSLPLNLSYGDCLEKLEMKKQELLLNDKNFLTEQYQKYFLMLNYKKIRFLKALHKEIKTHYPLDLLTKKLTWIILLIDSLTNWNFFVNLLLCKKIEKPKNTRPMKGYKPYKISSKIIFNHNGRR